MEPPIDREEEERRQAGVNYAIERWPALDRIRAPKRKKWAWPRTFCLHAVLGRALCAVHARSGYYWHAQGPSENPQLQLTLLRRGEDGPPLHGPPLQQRLQWLEETSASERFPPGTRM